MNAAPAFERVIIIGGGGAVGTLLARTLSASGSTELVILDPKGAPHLAGDPHFTVLVDDACAPSAATRTRLAGADLVVLATPEAIAVRAIETLLPLLRHGTLLVDTLSVKTPFATAIRESSSSAELLGINPMFAPSLGFAGRSVVAVPYSSGPQAARFLALIEQQGSTIVQLDAEAHDRACAALQAATHAAVLAFGLTLVREGYDLASMEAIAPPPHRALLALLARMLAADPEVYRDIQTENPYAAAVRAELRASLAQLDALASRHDRAGFAAAFDDMRRLFSGHDARYAELCAKLFAMIR